MYVCMHSHISTCTRSDAEIAAAREQLAALTHRRETQEISAADADRMRQERSLLFDSIRRVVDEREAAQTKVHEMELELQK